MLVDGLHDGLLASVQHLGRIRELLEQLSLEHWGFVPKFAVKVNGQTYSPVPPSRLSRQFPTQNRRRDSVSPRIVRGSAHGQVRPAVTPESKARSEDARQNGVTWKNITHRNQRR